MGFIRTKKVKGNSYAYLVENRWKKKTSKQKVKQYLGRVHDICKKSEFSFLQFVGHDSFTNYIQESDKEKIIIDLIAYETYCCGFKKVDKTKWICDNVIINLDNKTITKDNKNVVLKLNEGFMCCYSINRLFKYNKKGKNREVAMELARLFVDAGINIPKELYVELFQKINKNTNFLN